MEMSEILSMKKHVKSKLVAAVAMLLVSAIMVSSVTYAWFVLSTAPEITEMSTTAGSNGALEIALQSTTEDGSARAEIGSRIGDSSALASQPTTAANISWGNVIDLTDSYGLEGIALSPSRLNITAETSHVSTLNPLAVPKFGTDGRISALSTLAPLYYDSVAGTFVEGSRYGVTVIGERDEVNGGGSTITRTMNRQWLIDTSTARISTMRESMKTQLDTVISNNAVGIVDILKRYFSGTPGFVAQDITTVGRLADGFEGLMGEAEVALRYALLASCAADTVSYPDTEDGQRDLSAVYAKFNKLNLVGTVEEGVESDSIRKVATDNRDALVAGTTYDALPAQQKALYQAYGSVLTAVTSVSAAEDALQSAQDNIALAEANPADNTPLAMACTAMFDITKMYVAKTSDGTLHAASTLINGAQTVFGPWETELYTVRGSGLFSTMAAVLGDYTTEVVAVYDCWIEDWDDEAGEFINVNYPDTYTMNLHATTANSAAGFDPDFNTGCLQTVYNAAAPLRVDGSVTYTMDASDRVSAYGYSVDLAFKSSGGGELQLQQDAADRVSDDNSAAGRLPEDQTTQGGGSTMVFTVADDMTEAEAKALVQKVYVVFMDTNSGAIHGIGAADAAAENGIVWNTTTDPATQKDTNTVTAKLRMYNGVITNGILTKGSARADQSIVSMTADREIYITAVVYLDGDSVVSGDLSSDTTQSLFGAINLQFKTDASLTAMPYSGYYTAS